MSLAFNSIYSENSFAIIWDSIVYSRFERLNELTKSDAFGRWENKEGKRVFQTSIPLELQRGFNKKRINHRHHAMDALVIACASRNIINYLNNKYIKTEVKAKILRIHILDFPLSDDGQFGRIMFRPQFAD